MKHVTISATMNKGPPYLLATMGKDQHGLDINDNFLYELAMFIGVPSGIVLDGVRTALTKQLSSTNNAVSSLSTDYQSLGEMTRNNLQRMLWLMPKFKKLEYTVKKLKSSLDTEIENMPVYGTSAMLE